MGRPRLRSVEYREGYEAGYKAAKRPRVNDVQTSVRHRDGEYEMRCFYCRDWWPITTEFWLATHGSKRCRACWQTYHRLHEAGYRADEAVAEMKRQRSREHYAANKTKHKAAAKAWREANKERIRAYNREYRAKNKGRLTEADRQYRAENRAVILAKKREAYRQMAYKGWAAA